MVALLTLRPGPHALHRLVRIITLLLLLAGVSSLSFYNYLLFHGAAELFSAFILFGIFVIVWNSRKTVDNNFLRIFGFAAVFIGAVQILHAMSWEGMGVFPVTGSNQATQLWVIGRYLETLAVLLAILHLGYPRMRATVFVAIYALIFAFLILSVFYWHNFPVAYIDGVGLTPFKVISEYVVSAVLALCAFWLYRRRVYFDRPIFNLLIGALLFTIAAELALTFYISVSGVSNLVGHILKIVSYFLLYRAIVTTGILKPQNVLFRELKQSKDNFNAVLDNSADGISVTTLGGKRLFVNARLCELTGHREADLMQLDHLGYFHPDERDRIRLYRQQKVDGLDAPASVEVRMIRQDGTEFPAEIRPGFTTWEGNPAIINMIRDITDRKQAEAALRESEDFLNRTGEIAKIGGWEMDLLTRKAYWTRGTYDIVEIDYDAPIPGPDEHIAYYLPEYRQMIEAAMQDAIENDRPLDFTAELQTAKGNIKWCRALGQPVMEAGKCVRLSGTFQDITEQLNTATGLAESEEKFRTITEHSADAIFITDQSGVYTYVNSAASDLLGYSVLELTQMSIGDISPKEDLVENLKDLQRIVDTGSLYTELTLVRKDGSTVPVDLNAILLPNGLYYGSCRDISSRKESEARIEKERGRAQTYLDVAGTVFVALDIEGRVSLINRKGCQILGYPEAAILGKNWFDCFLPQARIDEVKDVFNLIISGNLAPVEYFENPVITRTGEERLIAWHNSIIYDDSGVITGLLSSGEDVTERRQLEKEVRQLDEKRLAFMDSATEVFAVFDADLNYIDVNQAFLDLWDYKREDMIGTNLLQRNPRVRKSGRADRYFEVIRTGVPIEVEYIRRNTRYGDQHVVLRAFKVGDGLGTISTDITAQKRAGLALQQSSENFKALAENADQGIAVIRNRETIYTNYRVAQWLGYSVEEFDQLPRAAFIHPDNRMELNRMRLGSKDADFVGPRLTVKYLKKDGTPLPVEITGSRTVWQGEPAILYISRDISSLLKAEEERIRTAKLESLGVLAGGIAHDFNNLLTGIMGNASLARRKVADEDVKQLLEQIERVSENAAGLTQQLLTFAKGGEPVKKVQPVGALIFEAARFVLRGSNVNADYSIPEDLWSVDVDGGQISQVISNIAINADQAMPDGGRIKIVAENMVLKAKSAVDLPKGDYLRISVTDSGIGIPQGILAKIFDPYYTTKQKGSGLGLATSFSIIQKHSGSIQIDSEPGKGTTVTVYLPAVKRTAAGVTAGQVRTRAGAGRILVMDDEAPIRDLIKQGLTDAGYAVTTAQDGQQAIDEYVAALGSGKPYDLVIMDLTIPGAMGGKEAIIELQKADPGVRAIVSSGYSNDPVMAEPARYGFRGVLTKPFKLESLREKVSGIIGE
jgi:PAS domain S-box-containing protein